MPLSQILNVRSRVKSTKGPDGGTFGFMISLGLGREWEAYFGVDKGLLARVNWIG
jgi:hypothetical protein